MKLRKMAGACAVFLTFSCATAHEKMAGPESCDLPSIAKWMRAASEYYYPGYDDDLLFEGIHISERRGEGWVVFFRLSPGWVGGSPTALLDTETCALKRMYRTQ